MTTKLRLENAIDLAALLMARSGHQRVTGLVEKLQSVARQSHRNAERHCNGELIECSICQSEGCEACLGTGYPVLARETRAMDKLRDALRSYRLRIYEQGDPRGWPIYLIPEESGPASEDASHYNARGIAVCPH